MAGLLGNFLDDPGVQMSMGLLGGTSPFFGPNVSGAYNQMQALRMEALKRQQMMQQLESGGIDLQQKRQNVADDEQVRQVLQNQPQMAQPQTGQPQMQVGQNFAGANPDYQPPQAQVMPGGKGVAIGAPPDSSKASYFDIFNRKADELERLGSRPAILQAKAYRDLAEKYRPEVKDTKTLVDGNGQRVTVNIFKDGTQQVVPFAPDKEKLHFQDFGASVQGLDPLTGQPVGQAMGKTLSPSDVLGAQTTMRGQNMTDARDRIGIAYNTGYNAPQYGFNTPNIPGVDTRGMSPATAAGVMSDVGKKNAEAVQQARVQLPEVESLTKQTIGLVDKMLVHPGFSTTVGAKGPSGAMAAMGYPIPGTDAADFVTLQKQVTGKQFLQAYQTLKGAGAITEVEGKKATAAIAAMDNSQSEAAYKAAAKDFQDVLRGTLSRMQSRAAGNVGGGGWSIRPIP